MKRDWDAIANGILEAVGGVDNIAGMTHCATRLRLNLRDDAKCDDEAVKKVDGVINTANAAGQYQVLIGTEVPKLYEKFEALVKGQGGEIESASSSDQGIVNKVSAPFRASSRRCSLRWRDPVFSAACSSSR